jgi:hypothetical protein
MTPTHAGINWRRGAFRLWIIASVLWCALAFSVALTNTNVTWFSSTKSPATIHVRISNTETWDYPSEWGVQRIRDDLQKRLAAEDEREREWAAQLPAARKAECRARRPTTKWEDEPADCARLFPVDIGFISVAPDDWEAQVKTPSMSAWNAIAAALPGAVGPPLAALALARISQIASARGGMSGECE